MLVIHASDLHLGRPIRAIATHRALAPECFAQAAERALKRLVEFCVQEQADLLLIAGDLIDHWMRDYRLGLRLIRELERLEHTRTSVFWVRGNHDAENRVIRNLLLPEHVRELGLDGVQTVRLEHLGVTLVGRSYAERCTETNLFAEFPEPDETTLTIGMLHTSADGMTTGDRYAPCGRRELAQRGYQYLALGHVHEPEIWSSKVPIAYSGCLQARSFFESGPRGCLKVQFDHKHVTRITHQALDVVRFGKIPIDVSQARSLDEVLACVNANVRAAVERTRGTALVVRCCLTGDCGIAPLLACNGKLRTLALRDAAESVSEQLSIDGFWAEAPHPDAPSLRLDDEQLVTRRDF